MAGEWIPEKARGLMSKVLPGSWEEVQSGVFQGRCPGEHLHHGGNAVTDCRVHVGYGAQGQPPGIYCLHSSCKVVLDGLNEEFRHGIFAKDENWKPQHTEEQGVVRRAPIAREAWIPAFSIGKLRGLVAAVPPCGPEFFEVRSVVDPRKVTPGEFLEAAFEPGERVLVFTEFKGPGDYLWEVGKGGYRLSPQRGVSAVRSKLPVDGGKDGVWYLSNPVTGQWYANPRRQGKYSRRSAEAVTSWRNLVIESDEEKSLKRLAEELRAAGKPEEAALREAESKEMPGLWMRLLAMSPLPIVAIYSSGGASWHALVKVNMASKADFDDYLRSGAKRVLPLVGADPGAMTPVRLTRLPGCTRGGKLQRLIYLNPSPAPKGVPIRDLAVRRKVEGGGK